MRSGPEAQEPGTHDISFAKSSIIIRIGHRSAFGRGAGGPLPAQASALLLFRFRRSHQLVGICPKRLGEFHKLGSIEPPFAKLHF